MTPVSYTVIAVCLFVAAFCAAIMGIGGGVLYTPVQLFFGVGAHEAATTSLSLIMMLSIGATIVYHRARKVDFAMALVFGAFSTCGAFSGGLLSGFVSEIVIVAVLVLAIALSSIGMFFRNGDRRLKKTTKKSWCVWERVAGGAHCRINVFVAVLFCLAAGAVSGMTGVGGGFIMVPVMFLVFGVPIDVAIATSGFMVGITAVAGFAGHVVHGHWNPIMTMVFAPAVLAGSMLGAKTMLHMNKALLRKVFAVFMLLLAVWLAARFLA